MVIVLSVSTVNRFDIGAFFIPIGSDGYWVLLTVLIFAFPTPPPAKYCFVVSSDFNVRLATVARFFCEESEPLLHGFDMRETR